MKEFTALNPKVHSIKTQHEDEEKEIKDKVIPETNKLGFEVLKTKVYHENQNKKTVKGVPKVVVKNELGNTYYINVLETNEPVKRTVMGFRSFNHEVFTWINDKIALSSVYDKPKMIDPISCEPFGYMK